MPPRATMITMPQRAIHEYTQIPAPSEHRKDTRTQPIGRRVIFPYLPVRHFETIFQGSGENSKVKTSSENSQIKLCEADSTNTTLNNDMPSTPTKPLNIPRKSASPHVEYRNSVSAQGPTKDDGLIRTIPRPSLRTLEIPEIPQGTPARRSLPRRSILSHYQSLPLPGAKHRASNTGIFTEIVSILRDSSLGKVDAASIQPRVLASSVPSLPSLRDEKGASSASQLPLLPRPSHRHMRRSRSEPSRPVLKSIRFDPRIWIREFQRSPEEFESTWYDSEDLETFKRHALALVMARDHQKQSSQIMITGTTRTMGRGSTPSTKSSSQAKTAFYTHAALTLDGEDANMELSSALQTDSYRAVVAEQEIKRILLVDPHDICITLFHKAFQTLLPRTEIVSASSAEQALERLAQQSFDIILVEERLKPLFHSSGQLANRKTQQSGSNLFRTLAQISAAQHSLWIGVSAHLAKDEPLLENSGADLCWTKPPPKMSDSLRNILLQKLLIKRGRQNVSQELFGLSLLANTV